MKNSERILKPAKCECELLAPPVSPCEILPQGFPGSLRINGHEYGVVILGYLPEVGEPVVDGYRLTKGDGTAHDLCLVAGILECTCGDFEFRRAARDPKGCKHCQAVRQLLQEPRDRYEPSVAGSEIGYTVEFDDP